MSDYQDEMNEGEEPSESDDYIYENRDGYTVAHDERTIGTFKTLRRASAALYLARERNQYWPNIWLVNERGNMEQAAFDSHTLVQTGIGWV